MKKNSGKYKVMRDEHYKKSVPLNKAPLNKDQAESLANHLNKRLEKVGEKSKNYRVEEF